MTKKELTAKKKSEDELKYGEYVTGPGHVFNDTPTNKEEALQHGNALAASGNYPVGTSGCFNVGISGGCGPECFVYLDGDCKEPQEIVPRLSSEELTIHNELYASHNNETLKEVRNGTDRRIL